MIARVWTEKEEQEQEREVEHRMKATVARQTREVQDMAGHRIIDRWVELLPAMERKCVKLAMECYDDD